MFVIPMTSERINFAPIISLQMVRPRSTCQGHLFDSRGGGVFVVT